MLFVPRVSLQETLSLRKYPFGLKTLYLIRHAKSSWNINGIPDIDRPLNERGYRDAHEMANRIRKKIEPGIIVSSPAIRAISTALIFARHFESDLSALELHPLLFDTNSIKYLQVISALPAEYKCAFLFGHNPVITETTNLLAGTQLIDIPTTGIVGIEFDVQSWEKAAESVGTMIIYDFPGNEGV